MFCQHCGNKNVDGAKYCEKCGKSLDIEEGAAKTAGFWVRLMPFIIDVYVLYLLVAILLWAVYFVFISDIKSSASSIIISSVSLLLPLVYITFSLKIYGTTIGKKLSGLCVVSTDGSKLSLKQALIRTASYLLSSLFAIGFIMAAFDSQHRTWHDRLAKTLVIKKGKPHFIISALILVVFCALVIWSTFFGEETPIDVLPNFNITGRLQPNTSLLDSLTTPALQSLKSVVIIVCGDFQGSGTIITKEGLLLTNFHVIENYEDGQCKIGFTDDISNPPTLKYYAKLFSIQDPSGRPIVLANERLDVAILEITATIDPSDKLPINFPVAPIGSSDKLQIGDDVHIAGYPGFGLGTITVTEGSVSGRNGDFLKVSAKLDQGNSGGALFNNSGELVGIPSAGAAGAFEGLAYSLSIDSVNYWLQIINTSHKEGDSQSSLSAQNNKWDKYDLVGGWEIAFPEKPKQGNDESLVHYEAYDSEGLRYLIAFADLPKNTQLTLSDLKESVSDDRVEFLSSGTEPKTGSPFVNYWKTHLSNDGSTLLTRSFEFVLSDKIVMVGVTGNPTANLDDSKIKIGLAYSLFLDSLTYKGN